MLKDRLSKKSGWQFHKWLFGPEISRTPVRNCGLDGATPSHALLERGDRVLVPVRSGESLHITTNASRRIQEIKKKTRNL